MTTTSVELQGERVNTRKLFKSESDSWLSTQNIWNSTDEFRTKHKSMEFNSDKPLNILYMEQNNILPKLPIENLADIYDYISPIQYPVNSGALLFSPNDVLSVNDILSPVPLKTYSPELNHKQLEFKHYKLIEELLVSEESYVSSLKMLQKFYLHPLLDNSRFPSGVPLYMISYDVEKLIETHEKFLALLNNELEHFNWKFVYEVSSNISKLIDELVENNYLYIEYCDIYQDVLMLSKIQVNSIGVKEPWINGWSHYLEATQPPTRKLDLSFMSLIQKPTARYGKYRLFLEALVKCTPKELFIRENIIINRTLENIKIKLNTLNNASTNLVTDKNNLIREIIDFNSSGFAIQFFGKNILIGSLVALWIEIDRIKTSTLAVIAFKSHLVLCDLNIWRGKCYTIKFIIPFSKCNIIEQNKFSDCGISTNYPYSIKLLFEIGKCQYEIIFAATSKHEFQIWNNTLTTLINIVNGPYQMDFSATDAGMDLIYKIPHSINPYKISLDIIKTYAPDRYIGKPISIKIFNSIYGHKDKNLIAEDINIELLEHHNEYLELTRYDRIKAEKKIGLIWSEELPRIMFERTLKLSRHLSLLNFHTLKRKDISVVGNEQIGESHGNPRLLGLSFPSSSVQKGMILPHDQQEKLSTVPIPPQKNIGRLSRVSSLKSDFFSLFNPKSKKSQTTL